MRSLYIDERAGGRPEAPATLSRAATVHHGLAPFALWLADPEVTEVCVNRPGEAFLFRSGAWLRVEAPALTPERLMNLANAAAVYAGLPFGPECPILSAALPEGERAQFVRPPAVPEGRLSLTIRKPATEVRTLADYAAAGFFEGGAEEERARDAKLLSLYESFAIGPEGETRGGTEAASAKAAFLSAAVASGKNIVIAGETGSGKTTFMKALMQAIPSSERILTIEDVPELLYGLPNHRNQVNLFYPSEARDGDPVTASVLLRSALRMKPDRILIAELRGGETFDFLSACLTGHGGSITSCHAGSCREALAYLALKTLQSSAGSRLPAPAIDALIASAVDIVVHVTAAGGRRRAAGLLWVTAPGTHGKNEARGAGESQRPCPGPRTPEAAAAPGLKHEDAGDGPDDDQKSAPEGEREAPARPREGLPTGRIRDSP